jgi:predicted nucleotidyltransferase
MLTDHTGQIDIVVQHRKDILRIVQKYGCSNPRVFGSVARNEANESSDIDFMVDPGETTSLFDLGGIYYELEQLLPVKFDLITSRQIPENERQAILREAIPVLGEAGNVPIADIGVYAME